MSRESSEPSTEAAGGLPIIFADRSHELARLQQHLQRVEGLHAQDRTFEDILDACPVVVYVKRVDGVYLFINRMYSELFNVDRQTVLGKTDRDIFPNSPRLVEAFRANDRRVAETRQPLHVEEFAPHPDGLHRYLSVKFPLFDEAGGVRAVAGISTDITALHHVDELLSQLHAAAELQRGLYPEDPRDFPGFDIAGQSFAAGPVCGDYFDFIRVSPDELVIVVGDACGHDLSAALLMVSTRAYLRGMLAYERSLAEVMQQLNRALTSDLASHKFMSLFLARVQASQRNLEFACAGHDGLLLRRDGDVQRLQADGLLLGLDETAGVHHVQGVELQPGDLAVFTTDGVLEARDGDLDLFGRRRVVETLAPLRGLASRDIVLRLHAAVAEFSGEGRLSDDATIVIVQAR